jgi:type I restriction enzyme S subunit
LVAKNYSDESSSDDLPSNWRVLNFGKFCDIEGGSQPPKSQFISEPRKGYVRLLQIRDLGERPVPTFIPIGSVNRFCKEGEILIGRYGASVGKIFWAQDGTYNVALTKFIWPEDALIASFAFLLLKSEYLQGPLASITRSAQAGFNKGDLAAINFPLPPIAKQHRIVAKVDELMALCDRLEGGRADREATRDRLMAASLARLNAPDPDTFRDDARFALDALPALTARADQITQLRQTILNLAVRGKLVPQDPNDEPVSAQLHRLKVAAVADGAFDLPTTWSWVNVGSVADARLGKMLDKAKNKGLPRPYLRNINVRWFDFDLSDLLEMPFEEDELSEFALCAGDVLICEGGEPGRAAVWDERAKGIYFQKAIHRVRFAAFVDPAFFVKALRASADDGRLVESFTGTGIKHFTGKSLDAYRFPLPPLAEQHRIVAKVVELMALCDRLEASLTSGEDTRRRLLDALLAEALHPAEALDREAAE